MGVSHSNQSMTSDEEKPSLTRCVMYYEDPLCKCGTVVCKMQPYCLDHRCLTVKLSKGAFIVFDQTYSKVFRFPTKIKSSSLLPKREFSGTGLNRCNVICFSKNLFVIQVFCQNSIKFVICDCICNEILLCYDLSDRYVILQTQKLHLFECCISPNKSLFLIKTNYMYQRLCCNNRGISVMKLVKLDLENGSCTELPCPRLKYASFGVAFDHTSYDNHLLIVTVGKVYPHCPVITRHSVNSGLHDFERVDVLNLENVYNTCQPCFVNVQSTSYGNHMLVAVLTGGFTVIKVLGIILYSVNLYYIDKDSLEITDEIYYKSRDSVYDYAPKLSTSGRFMCCGGKNYELPHPEMKSLKNICQDYVLDIILPEEIHELPLPLRPRIYLENRL